MNIQSSGKEPLNYSFNQEKWSNKPLMQEIPLQKAYFLLVNVEEHPEILPFAFDLSTSHLASVEKHFDTPEFSVWQPDEGKLRLQALTQAIATKGKGLDYKVKNLAPVEARRTAAHYFLQYMPMALVDGCWLQTGARVATAHTVAGAIVTGLYQHQVRAFVADPGRHFVNDYKDAFARVGGELGDVSSLSFANRPEFADASFELPLFLLALAQTGRTHFPEIIGANLAWQFLGIPASGLTLIADFCQAHGLPQLDSGLDEPEFLEKGHAMAVHAVEGLLEDAQPADRAQIWSRILKGAGATVRLWNEWFEATRLAAPEGPPDPRQEMINLMWSKASHAHGYHGNRPLGDRLLDEHLDPQNFDGPKLLNALADSPWVRPGHADKSPLLNHLIGFGGPMLGVFSPLEQQIIREWINSLPPRDKSNRSPGRQAESTLVGEELKPALRVPRAVQGRIWQPGDVQKRSDAMFAKCSVRELYHHLVNVEFFPEILPRAERFARDRLERSMASLWKGERAIPLPHYDPDALDRWVDEKHRAQVDSYRPPAERPEVSKDAFIEATVQLAPLILIDGGWLQGMASPATINTTVGRMLFHVFVEEIGEGNADEHHANIYRKLLKSMDVSAPAVESRDFINWDRIDAGSFDVPTLWLALSCFPRHFMPEILGLNLAVELAGVGAPYMEARDTLRKFRYPTLFVDVHNAADNVTSGHSAWALKTIKHFMDQTAEREGPHNLDSVWHRVWSGVRLTLPQIGGFKLLGHRAKRRLLGPDKRSVPLIFPT